MIQTHRANSVISRSDLNHSPIHRRGGRIVFTHRRFKSWRWITGTSAFSILFVMAVLCFCALDMISQAQDRPVRFDVVSIKANRSGSMNVSSGANNTGYYATNVPLGRVIAQAYLVSTTSEFVPPVDWVKGAPAWVMNERYDIAAKADDASIEAMKGMTKAQRTAAVAEALRGVLADRFKLRARTIPIDVPGYALLVSKRGTKMKEAAQGEPLPSGGLTFGGAWKFTPVRSPDGRQSSKYWQISMPELAAFLGSGATPVVDQTGLSGRYDFELPVVDTAMPGEEGASMPRIDLAHRFDWAAVGLDMKSMKVQVSGVAIDHIERPSEN